MMSRRLPYILSFLMLGGCAVHFLQHDRASQILKNDEYENRVQIQENAPPPTEPTIEPAPPEPPPPPKRKHGRHARAKTPPPAATPAKNATPSRPLRRQPDIEDDVGFEGRRPKIDPFRVGEKVTLELSYFLVTAGSVDVEVLPFAMVNGRKAYHFEVTAKSYSFFSHIYAVDDKAVTYLDYEDMRPFNLQISIKESKQLAEARTLFDWNKLEADYWQKRITKEKGERSKKINWKIESYAQNVISAAYYLRTFQLAPGKKLAFRVADEGKNIVFKGEVLRRETIDTPVGPLKTLVIQPQVTVDGVFSPMGEVYIWLTDDDRKFLVQLQTKIKIGSVMAKLKSIDRGQDPPPPPAPAAAPTPNPASTK